MRLVIRRLRGARTLLVAAAGVALVAIVLLTGLVGYSRDVVAAGAASSIASAPVDERSLLVRASAGADTAGADTARADTAGADTAGFQARDAAVRREFAGGVGGAPARIYGAGYAAGRQLTGEVGDATPDAGGLVFASVVFLDDLAARAELVEGAWPRPGQRRTEAAVAAEAAAVLGLRVGDRVPLTNRLTGAAGELSVVGIWRPRDLTDPYWRLTPRVGGADRGQSATYGPFVLDRADFLDAYLPHASAAWLVDLDLTRVDVPALRRVAAATQEAAGRLPASAGLGRSAFTDTGIGRLSDRLRRADLVGRSALLTPLLLVIVLGGYALVLLALLLGEHRRAETALIRARGAARLQIAGLAAREAALVVAPAAVLAPLLATELLRRAGRADVSAGVPTLAWIVSIAAALACMMAMLAPAMRGWGTYIEELAQRSRPGLRGFAARAAVDLALVAFAVLAWTQLRQHSSPVSGAGETLGIDPLLGAAPTVAVLAGAVIVLRLLPVVTRLAERLLARTQWTAATFGFWQAGRRPHAGPVLLLALAVAVSTLALGLASTTQRSLRDQADFQVGADLRLVEANGVSAADRTAALAALPGVRTVLGVERDTLSLGAESVPASLVALDAGAAPGAVRLREDLAGGSPAALFAQLADARIDPPALDLPAGTRRLQGRIVTRASVPDLPARTSVIVLDGSGGYASIALGDSRAGHPLSFSVDVAGMRLAGFKVETALPSGATVDWTLTDLVATGGDGAPTTVDLDGRGWHRVQRRQQPLDAASGAGRLSTTYRMPVSNLQSPWVNQAASFAIVPARGTGPVPAAATPAALAALRAEPGDVVRLQMNGVGVDTRIAATVAALPGSDSPAAVLVDLPSLNTVLLADSAVPRRAQEWWLGTDPDRHAAAADAAARLAGLRVLDRRSIAEAAGREPYGAGARGALSAAAIGAVLLALIGVAVDVRATSRRRVSEFAVMRTMGASAGMLSRALLTEQALLAGLGVVSGLLVGLGVAATMAPLVILTPSAAHPTPDPLPQVPWLPVGAAAMGLFAASLVLVALVATTLRRRLAVAQLRIGDDR